MVIKVERGSPTPEELAVVVAVVRARVAALESAADGPRRLAAWADPARTVPRRVPRPGPGAWRMSGWPA